MEERTAELEAKNRELEAFTYSVSHDLKAPLRGMDGYGRLLAEGFGDRLGGEGRLFLNDLLNSVTLMNQLIDDLLTYSRLERRSPTGGKIHLKDLAKKLIYERQGDILRRNIQVIVDIPGGFVESDQEGLSQVLRNLGK